MDTSYKLPMQVEMACLPALSVFEQFLIYLLEKEEKERLRDLVEDIRLFASYFRDENTIMAEGTVIILAKIEQHIREKFNLTKE